jgi:SAM-dependent methyltransferase
MSEQKDSVNVEQVFDVLAKRYDAWYDKPFGKSAFNLEKACIESLCKNLRRPFLEIGVGGEGESLPFVDSVFDAVFIIVTLCFVDEPAKVLKEASRLLKEDGAVILGLILKESPWASFYEEKGEAGNIFYRMARFYSFEELKAMYGKAGLKILEMRSTMFQAPTENPLSFEPPRIGYYKEAGFVAVKLEKVNQ